MNAKTNAATGKTDAVSLLKADHRKVEGLFEQFEKAGRKDQKKKLATEICSELTIHATIEEEIFYPAVRKHVGSDLMNEADEEHHVARVLVAELDGHGGGDHREAKFTVLAESVRHHIREEENEVLPKAKGADIDFEALGDEILARKQGLKKNGVPPDAEHAMVAAVGGRGDTPAAKARRATPARAVGSRKSAAPKSKTRAGKGEQGRTRARSASRQKSSRTR